MARDLRDSNIATQQTVAAGERTAHAPEGKSAYGQQGVATGATSRGFGGGIFTSLIKYRDFRYLFMGNVFSSAGQWIQQITLSWLIYDMTGSTMLLGLINGMRALPFLLTGPLGGVVADRVDRRRLMMGTQLVLLVSTLIMGTMVLLNVHQVWHLFVFTVVTAMAWSFNQPVRQAVVPSVVPKHDLQNAIALNSAGFNMSRIVGPALGGLLIAWFGAGGNFFVQAVGYVMVAVMIYQTNLPPTPPAAREQSMVANMAEGGRWVWANPLMRMLMMLALVPVVIALPYSTLMPVFSRDVLGLGPEGLGYMFSAVGVGALTGALTVAGVRVKYRGRMMLTAMILLGVCLVGFSMTRSLPLALFALALTGACQMTYMATNQTVLQMMIPDELRGRVMSIYMLNQGLLPLGAFFAGAMATWLGAPTTVAMMGMSVIGLGLLAALSLPAMRNLE